MRKSAFDWSHLGTYFLRDGWGILFLGILCLQMALRFPDGDYHYRISSDAEGYYLYLPGVWIYDGFVDQPLKTADTYPQHPHSGKVLSRYTYGVALMEAPVFAIAHLTALQAWFHAKAPDGYSNTYNDALISVTILYMMLGLWVLLKVLQRHFIRSISWLTVLLLLGGTNLWFYTVGMVGMSHVFSFFLVSLLLYLTPGFYERPGWRQSLRIGLVLGLLVLVRPTNLLIGLYLLLYHVNTLAQLKQCLVWWGQQLRHIWWIPLLMFGYWIPQFAYWHYITGQWIYDSYTGYGFVYWNDPFLWQVWFGVQNGLFIYSPILLLGIGGLIAGIPAGKYQTRGITLIFLLMSYVFASWQLWWFGSAFGHRAFIDLFPMLALPFAYSLHLLGQQKPYVRILTGLVLVLLVYYSLGMSYLYRHPWEGPAWNWSTYWAVVEQLF